MKITVEKLQFIYENYQRMSIKELAKELELSPYQVAKAIQELRNRGLIKKKKRLSVFDKFVEILKQQSSQTA